MLDEPTRCRLLDADLPFLRRQLAEAGWRVVVVNGRTVMDWVKRAGLVSWVDAAGVDGRPGARVCVGDGGGVRFVGWSCNLQSQPGALALGPVLAGRLADLVGGSRGDSPRVVAS
jgi:hypothetical protein